MSKRGLLVNIGAHGQPPVGLMYHAEMGFTQAGGLSSYEVGPRPSTIEYPFSLLTRIRPLEQQLGMQHCRWACSPRWARSLPESWLTFSSTPLESI